MAMLLSSTWENHPCPRCARYRTLVTYRYLDGSVRIVPCQSCQWEEES